MPGRTRTTWAKGEHGQVWGKSRWGGANGPGKGPEALQPVARTKEVLARMAKLKALLEPHLDKVALTWLEIMTDPNAPPQARIHAAEKIAERVEGKVSDKLALLDTRNADEMTDEELALIASRGRAEASDAAPDTH